MAEQKTSGRSGHPPFSKALRMARILRVLLFLIAMLAPWGPVEKSRVSGLDGMLLIVEMTSRIFAIPLGALLLSWILVIIRPEKNGARFFYLVTLIFWILGTFYFLISAGSFELPTSHSWGGHLFIASLILAFAAELVLSLENPIKKQNHRDAHPPAPSEMKN